MPLLPLRGRAYAFLCGWRTGYVAEHPWPKMRALGLHLTLNTDDPAMIDDDLGTEYAALAQAHGHGFAEMVQVGLAGVDATWLDEADRALLRHRVEREAAELGRQLGPEKG